MKIIFLSTLYEPHVGGGAEITLRYLVEGLAQQGIDVVVLTVGPEPGLRREVVNGVTVWRAGYRNLYFHHGAQARPAWQKTLWHMLDVYNPLMQGYLREVVALEKPDVASCHNLPGWSVAVWQTLESLKVPVVQVLHDQYLLCIKSTMFKNENVCERQCVSCALFRCPHRQLSRIPVGLVGVSAFILEKLRAADYFPRVLVSEAIHNVRTPPVRVSLREGDGRLCFGFIGTLVPAKGIEHLLASFMRTALPHWRLRVAGSGESKYVSGLRARFPDARIEFLGQMLPGDFYPSIDICVVPSVWDEPLGMVVVEAMMYGLPVLGSCRGGIPEMIQPAVNGMLFDPEDASAFDATMVTAANDLLIWRERSDAIRASVAAHADIDAWIKRWQLVYQRVVKCDALV